MYHVSGKDAEQDVLKIFNKVTAQAMADEEYKKRYLANPGEVLAEAGLQVPPNVTFKVTPASSISADYQVKDGDTVYLVLPQVEEFVQDESLAVAAAASCDTTASTAGTVSTCVSSASSKSSNSCS